MAIELVAVAAATVANEARRNRAIQKAEAAWAPYAAAHGMTFEAARGWIRREWPRVEGTLGGAQVAIEMAVHATDWDYSTACVAATKAAPKGHLELTREGIASRVAHLFGAQDIIVGDEAFDAAYVVKASPEPLALQLLTTAVRAELAALDVSRLTYGEGSVGGLVVAEILGIVQSRDVLDRTLRLVAELADAMATG
jgi:hypothetical protein